MNLYGEPARAIAGQKFGLQDVTESHIAAEDIEPGAALFGPVGDDRVFKAHNNIVSLVASADLAAENSLKAKVNGVMLAGIAFDTDTDKTLAALADAINADKTLAESGISASVVTGAKTLTVVGESDIESEIAVTGGSSQPTFTAIATTSMKFVGVARHEELACKEGTGFYPKKTAVNVMTHGEIYVPVAEDAEAADKKPAYVVLSGDDKGKFTDEASGNYDTGCVFRSDAQDGLARVEVRGLK